jgi:DNA-directed RNA polymerase subunit beta'
MIKDRNPLAREMLLRETKERPVIVNRAPTLHRYNMVAAYPQMTAGKTIRVHPFIEAGMNADYDGDTMMVHAPVTPKSVEEAKTMTLSNILFSDKSKSDLLMFPKHEAIMGLSHASQQDDKGKNVKFKTTSDAMNAYKAGKITLGTHVTIEKD